MRTRVPDLDAAREVFTTLADAEGANIPFYARLCRTIARHDEVLALLLEAPSEQRLPVLVLAALHDLVLRQPDLPLAAWYPSVTGEEPLDDDPEGALLDAVRSHRAELVDLLQRRQVQTNEVNRCAGWYWALSQLTASDPRPLYLVDLGASAGLNLLLDRYEYRYELAPTTGEPPRATAIGGLAGSPVQLGSRLLTERDEDLDLGRPLPPVVGRVGLDQHPLDPTDEEDARWLAACTWPEQRVRFERLGAALDVAATEPPKVVAGDAVDDLDRLLADAPAGAHVVVLSSWVLVYLEPPRRAEVVDVLAAAATSVEDRGGRLSLLTLEAAHVVPSVQAPALPDDAPAELVHSSLLAVTSFEPEPVGRPLARCQAHLLWCNPLV